MQLDLNHTAGGPSASRLTIMSNRGLLPTAGNACLMVRLPHDISNNCQLYEPVDYSNCLILDVDYLRGIIFQCGISYFRADAHKIRLEFLPSS